MAETELKYSVYKGSNSGSNSSTTPRNDNKHIENIHAQKYLSEPNPIPSKTSPEIPAKAERNHFKTYNGVERDSSSSDSNKYNSHNMPSRTVPNLSIPMKAKRDNFKSMPKLERINHVIDIPSPARETTTDVIEDMNEAVDTDDSDHEVTIRYDIKGIQPSRQCSKANLSLSSLITKNWVALQRENS